MTGDAASSCRRGLEIVYAQFALGGRAEAVKAFCSLAATYRSMVAGQGVNSPAARRCAEISRGPVLETARAWWDEGRRDHWTWYLGMRSAAVLYGVYLDTFPDPDKAPAIALERARLLCELAKRGIQRIPPEEVERAFELVIKMVRAHGARGAVSADLLRRTAAEGVWCRQVVRDRQREGD